MAFKEHPLHGIVDFIPDGSFEDVVYFLETYRIHLKITKDRKSLLGTYKPAWKGQPHTITVNGTLNKYHFLITFIHELAHLINYLNHGARVRPHGAEWKQAFGLLLERFHSKDLFPKEIQRALSESMKNMSASTCSDPHLYELLSKYNTVTKNTVMVKTLPLGAYFSTEDGKHFVLKHKRRTRYECVEVDTKRSYLFPGIYEVLPQIH